MIQTVGALKEKAAIFCAAIRGVKQAAVEDELVDSQDCQ